MSQPLSAMSAALRIGRLALRRTLRGKVVWISTLIALAPLAVLVLAGSGQSSHWHDIFALLSVLLAVIPSLHMAPIVAEEIEDRTFTYLWSRPFPRWALLLGKLLALTPLITLLLAVTVAAAAALVFRAALPAHLDVLASSVLAVIAGVIAASAVSVGIGSLLPRHATATSLFYLLILDMTVGAMPFAIENLSVNHHVRQIASAAAGSGEAATSVIWTLGIAAVWLGVAVWRVSVTEYATDR